MANKQVRITDQEHQLILLIRGGGVDLEVITGLVADMVIRSVSSRRPSSSEEGPNLSQLQKKYRD